MFELITSILVIYVIGSILRRDGERKREVARLQARIAELHRIVTSSKGPGEADPERLIQWELHDLQLRLHDALPTGTTEDAFEQLHYVEEKISRSVVMARDLPTEAESTLA